MSQSEFPKSLSPLPESSWQDRFADKLEELLKTVDSKALRPMKLIVSIVVYGILIMTSLILTCALLSISGLRIIDVYLVPSQVWIGYLAIGGIFTLLGLLIWSKRTYPTN